MYYDEVYVQQQQMEIYAVQSQQRNITAVVDLSVNCRQHIYFITTTVCNRTSITAVLTQCRDFS